MQTVGACDEQGPPPIWPQTGGSFVPSLMLAEHALHVATQGDREDCTMQWRVAEDGSHVSLAKQEVWR